MTRTADRTGRSRRWAGLGLSAGAATALAAGCSSTDIRRTPDHLPAAVGSPSALPAGDPVRPAAATEPAKPAGPEPGPAPAAGPPAAVNATVDLGTALRLAGVGDPTINLARELVTEAQASLLLSRVLLVPSLNAGGNLHVHTGTLQASTGLIRHLNEDSFYFGFGARTLAAESVAVPGVRIFGHLGDAYFEPVALRQRVATRAAESRAAENNVLLEVARDYLELVGAEARVELLRASEADIAEVVRLTAAYARAGQGRAGDANRAAATADLLRRQRQQADEGVAVASARLAARLSLDPSDRLHSPPGAVGPVRLVDEETPPAPLVEQAVRDRPELAAARTAVGEARTRTKQEKLRPYLPTVAVGFSAGLFGGGADTAEPLFGPFRTRQDFDFVAFWTLGNAGAGNAARVHAGEAVYGQAVAEYGRQLNRVRQEVATARADAQAAARRMVIVARQLAAAEEGLRLDVERIKNAEGLPIEATDSFRQVDEARLELIAAVTEYNVAQFRLFVALGASPLSRPVPEPVGPGQGTIVPGLPTGKKP